LGYPEPFEISHIGSGMMDDKEHFDIFTHHARFHAANVRSVMPADTKRVTILREPASLFESLYSFFHLETIFKDKYRKYDLATLLEMTNIADLFDSKTRKYRKIGRNQVTTF
jgi:hypothetical protein